MHRDDFLHNLAHEHAHTWLNSNWCVIVTVLSTTAFRVEAPSPLLCIETVLFTTVFHIDIVLSTNTLCVIIAVFCTALWYQVNYFSTVDIIHLKASSLQKATSLNRFPNKSTLCKTVLQVKTVFLYCTCKTNCRTLDCDHSNKWTPFLALVMLHRFHYWTMPGSITIVSKEHERWRNCKRTDQCTLCSVWYWYGRKRADIIMPQTENTLWMKGILGCHSLASLLNTIFYLNGKKFHLRGYQEHATLRFSQIDRFTNPNCYMYYKYSSKNHPGGIADPTEGKIVLISATNSSRCHVAILYFYFSKIPPLAIKSYSFLYMKLMPYSSTIPWLCQ